jgi:predicted negative regulator of RcsB-dependent stress response
MAYDIDEQENLESLKAWWASYGNLIMGVLIAVLLAFGAWNGWKWYQRDQAGKAMLQFEVLQKAAETGDIVRVKDAAGSILENYRRTAYAPRAALVAADAYVKSGDSKSARAQLQWVIDHGGDVALVAIARLRLAGLLIDDKSFDDALKVISAEPPAAFAALFADRRGDVLFEQGKRDEARKAYEEALAKLDPNTDLRSTIQLKLDALGGA